MTNVLVTGINGFVGHHLTRSLHEQNILVFGTGRQPAADSQIKDMLVDYRAGDMTHVEDVSRLPLDRVDAVINLAGLAAVGQSFDEPDTYMDVNVGVLSVLCKRLQEINRKDVRVVAISSGNVYAPDQLMPLSESSRTSTLTSPYAASKLAMEQVAIDFRANGYDCVIARPFNHLGPGQSAGFILPDLYAKLQNADDVISVGNLETKRDYTDVRDVARAYIALATSSTLSHDIYNICSGRSVAGKELLAELEKACGKLDLRAVTDKSLFRPSDIPELYGDSSRLQSETGWTPAFSLTQTIEDFVNTKS